MLLDFDPDTAGIASQPSGCSGPRPRGKARSHAPDYFARLADTAAAQTLMVTLTARSGTPWRSRAGRRERPVTARAYSVIQAAPTQ